MVRVRSISNHPYGDRMRVKGVEYEVADEDLGILVALSRVVPISDIPDARPTYSTRELQASLPTPRTRRRTSALPSGTSALSPDDEI